MKQTLLLALLLVMAGCPAPVGRPAPSDYALPTPASYHRAPKQTPAGDHRAPLQTTPCVTEAGGAMVIAENGKTCH
jgi:hypothetical protein